ncbi:Uncharacterised protein [Leminorella richardii]|uniref:Uncharacterized protein n=1 Tax=Leminorella richardii TaxID=158841 RepID=A0A2X4V0K7_9GAMM|nr:hypothetical protein [Leminorella richardii]SQI44159.1 Uncharacterised protein [Leminorella richardii]
MVSYLNYAKNVINNLPDENNVGHFANEAWLQLREYFRRWVLLVDELSLEGIGNPLLFKLSTVLGVDVTNSIEKRLSTDFVNIDSRALCGLAKVSLKKYLIWSAAIDEGHEVANRHRNMFNPLIEYFSFGYALSLHHGEILFGPDWYSTGLFIRSNYANLELRLSVYDEQGDQ